MRDFPIDAVITWVDGSDPAFRERLGALAPPCHFSDEQMAAPTRFSSIGEIRYCVASIRRFAPFIRKIFIVTDGQDPKIEGEDIEIVDHKVIYRGYEQFLPVFCARSIETVIWRIPSLSEHFIYFNDDFVLRRPCRVEDFFQDSLPVCYAHPFSIPFVKAMRLFRKTAGYKDTQVNAAALTSRKWTFPYIGHLPHPALRSVLEAYYSAHPDVMEANMSCRFRSPDQFNPQALAYMVSLDSGRCVMRRRKGVDLYLKPRPSRDYISRKLRQFDAAPQALAICLNSLDLATPSDRKLVFAWLDSLLLTTQDTI